MIIAIDKEGYILLFETTNESYVELETIDIENNEYIFYDEKGLKYKAIITSSPKIFFVGSFELISTNQYSKNDLLYSIKQSKGISHKSENIKDINNIKDLEKYILNNH